MFLSLIRKEGNSGETEKDIRLSREYDEPLTAKDKKRELKWLTKKFEAVKEKRLATKINEIQPWDLNIFFAEYKLPASNKIPLKTLFTAISQITTDTLYNKVEIAFRIQSQQIQEEDPEMTYNEFVTLIEDMIITGHFTSDSLIIRRRYFPSQFGVRNAEEISDLIFDTAELDKKEDGSGIIKLSEMGEALTKLAAGRKMYENMVGFLLPITYKPWMMVWYCSERSKAEISEAKSKAERKKRREEKRAAKLAKQREENMDVDMNEGEEAQGDLQVQTN